jgi:hypothetical protein
VSPANSDRGLKCPRACLAQTLVKHCRKLVRLCCESHHWGYKPRTRADIYAGHVVGLSLTCEMKIVGVEECRSGANRPTMFQKDPRFQGMAYNSKPNMNHSRSASGDALLRWFSRARS